ncbi:deoxynucleoside kinase [Candidatus Dependentiae bacterium]|nr:deoxynucleoside kinase [Candidatus Dependentiae bacterium]
MYIVEGNIGAGKSTFLKLIEKHMPQIGIALEPLHNWQKKVYGQSLLANFYQEPRRWSYSLETFAMICRVREHIREQEHSSKSRIVERSIYSGHYCFVLTGYQNGFMTDLEWSMYQEWFNYLIPQRCKPPQGFIYLRTTPEVAYKRIKKRNRLAEKNITFAYLKQIHDQHERFLLEKNDVLQDLVHVPVLILECDTEFENNAEQLNKHLLAVQEFIIKTSAHQNPEILQTATPEKSLNVDRSTADD